jgi:hypothetical protein
MEPQPNSAAAASGSPPDRRRFPRASRSALSNDAAFLPKQPLSPRAQDRRRKDLAMAFVNALGGEQACSELTMVAVRQAVELTVTAEVVRAGMLTGNLQSDITGLIKLENAARRAVLALGIKVEKASTPRRARASLLPRRRRAGSSGSRQTAASALRCESIANTSTFTSCPGSAGSSSRT